MKRNRAVATGNQHTFAAGERCHLFLEARGVAQGRAHEQELRLRKLQKRQLPCPAALRIGVEMELIHNNLADIRSLTLAQSNIRQDFGGTTDNGGIRVNSRIPGNHTDIFGTKNLDKIKELLGNKRFNGCGVVGTLPSCQTGKMRRHRHCRFTRTGGGSQHHIMPRRNFQDSFILSRVKRHASAGDPSGERLIDFIRGERIASIVAPVVTAGILREFGGKVFKNAHGASILPSLEAEN